MTAWNEGAFGVADVELARAADALLGILDHFLPLGDPADRACDREQDRKHFDGEAHGSQRDAGIEVDVGIEFLFNEVLVFPRNMLKLHGNFEQWLVTNAEGIENLVAGRLHDLRAWVVILVDPVAEPHQAEAGCFILSLLDVLGDALDGTDFLQHVERCFVGTAVGGAPQTGDAGGYASKWIGARGAGQANGGRRSVLFVVCVQNEDAVEGACYDGINGVGLARDSEAHLQEVAGVIQIVARVDEGLTDGILVGHGSDRRHLGDKAASRDGALPGIVDVGGVVIERRQRANHTTHHGHRVSVTPEARIETSHLLVQHRVIGDGLFEFVVLELAGEISVQEEIADLDEGRLFSELVDRVAAMQKYAGVAVNIGDF